MRKVLVSYKGPVKGLRPYLLSLMYQKVVPFPHTKKTARKRPLKNPVNPSIA